MPPEDDDLAADTAAVLDNLRGLHADEVVHLADQLTGFEHYEEEFWVYHSFSMIKQYCLYCLSTTVRVAWAFMVLPTTWFDRLAIIVLSVQACFIMFFMLVFCLLWDLPFIGRNYEHYSKKWWGGLSIVNASYPTIFSELKKEHVDAARKFLSAPFKDSDDGEDARVFNLDAAKLLLQCSALMYERSSEAPIAAARTAASYIKNRTANKLTNWSYAQPGQRATEACGKEGAAEIKKSLKDSAEDKIATIAAGLGLEYCTVSDLNTVGSSFCGLFWNPQDTFIIVAFKGTTPTDFKEWKTDFTFHFKDGNSWLQGFDKVHEGFYNKIFPDMIARGSRVPYFTITTAIKDVTKLLLKNHPAGTKINIWVTGHSLGCALASLVYARLIMELEAYECGRDAVIRDAYLFAAPVVCDATSSSVFNNKLNHFHEQRRMMWRITNANDAVATKLPEEGDDKNWTLSPWNYYSFAHLGCEIKLREPPESCKVNGGNLTNGSPVVINSAFNKSDIISSAERSVLQACQKVPIFGPLLSHGTGNYWSALQAVAPGECDWLLSHRDP